MLEHCTHFIHKVQPRSCYSICVSLNGCRGEFPAISIVGDGGCQQLDVCSARPTTLHCDFCVTRESGALYCGYQ